MDTFSKEWKSLLELIFYGVIIAAIFFVIGYYFEETFKALLPFLLIFAVLFGPSLLVEWLEKSEE